MRSFAVIAGLAAAVNAHAVAYPEASAVVVSSALPAYPVSPVVESKATPTPAAVTEAYPVSSEAAAYTTKVITGLSTVCESTTITAGGKTYTVSSSTTLIDNDCVITTSYLAAPTPAVVPTPAAASSANTHYAPPVYSQAPPAHVPYPSAGNGTAPYPTGAKPAPSASATKPSTPQFTGAAAAQAGVGLMAVIGAVAAFL